MLEHRNDILRRFKLTDGQFFAYYRYKNLQWFLSTKREDSRDRTDMQQIGYGDLTDDQILYIAEHLDYDEEFIGYNEHHGGPFQQTNTPMVRITSNDIKFREDIVAQASRSRIRRMT